VRSEGTPRAPRAGVALALALAWALLGGFSYRVAVPGRSFSFPRDHASHPDFKTEWWYYTGHLAGERGGEYGYQVTFFRVGVRDRQDPASGKPLFSDLYMAHFALSDKRSKRFRFFERAQRGFPEKAGASADAYRVWIESWKAYGSGGSHFIEVDAGEHRLKLELKPLKPPVLHGENGFSRKGEGEGNASYYYSLTRLRAEGELVVGGTRERVSGQSWMDHEFGTHQLAEDQVGWDWFSVQLDDRSEIMLYLMRRKDGSVDRHSSGTLVDPSGRASRLGLGDFRVEVSRRWKSPRSGAVYPMRWRVTLPRHGIELEIVPFFEDQELDTAKSTRVVYWEGAAEVSGKVKGRPVRGLAYVEMTGYAGKLRI
jgi:predicted secreted hydrolase